MVGYMRVMSEAGVTPGSDLELPWTKGGSLAPGAPGGLSLATGMGIEFPDVNVKGAIPGGASCPSVASIQASVNCAMAVQMQPDPDTYSE